MQTKKALIVILITILVTPCIVQSASASGPFDQACTNCQGTGKVTTQSTQSCTACNGQGSTTTTGTCTTCQGSGKVTTTVTCTTCGGDGKVQPDVTLKSKNGYGTLSGLDWVARVEATYQNEENTGTYGQVKTIVHTVSNDYTHYSARTYFAPHTDVKVTVDTKEIGALTDWTYSVSLTVEDITCASCSGSGGKSSLTTCSNCNGYGQITKTTTCTNCQGTGQITLDSQVSCIACNGTGSTTNWATIGVVMVIVFAAIGAIVGSTLFIKKKNKVASTSP